MSERDWAQEFADCVSTILRCRKCKAKGKIWNPNGPDRPCECRVKAVDLLYDYRNQDQMDHPMFGGQ